MKTLEPDGVIDVEEFNLNKFVDMLEQQEEDCDSLELTYY